MLIYQVADNRVASTNEMAVPLRPARPVPMRCKIKHQLCAMKSRLKTVGDIF